MSGGARLAALLRGRNTRSTALVPTDASNRTPPEEQDRLDLAEAILRAGDAELSLLFEPVPSVRFCTGLSAYFAHAAVLFSQLHAESARGDSYVAALESAEELLAEHFPLEAKANSDLEALVDAPNQWGFVDGCMLNAFRMLPGREDFTLTEIVGPRSDLLPEWHGHWMLVQVSQDMIIRRLLLGDGE